MNTNSLLLLAMLLVCIKTSFAQETYKKGFGGSGQGDQTDFKEIKGNGYLIAGSTNYFGAGSYDAYCIKLDEKGKMLWSKTYGTSSSETNTKCWGTTDGGFILTFNTYYPYRYKEINVTVVKCDKNGNIQWSKCIKSAKEINSGSSTITPKFIYQSKSGDYYLLYDWFSFHEVPQFTLVKLDATGALIWNKSASADPSYSYESTQISEMNNGDIIVAENAYGDNYYTFGNYIHLFLFAQQTGTIKLSKAIYQYYNGGYSAYLNITNLVIEENKVFVTGGYSKQGMDAGVCWFPLQLDDTKVKAKYITYHGYHTYQYLINKNLIKQPEGSFSPYLIFTKDGGYLYANTYIADTAAYDRDIAVNKYDSFGRICPHFTIPIVDTTIHNATFYVYNIGYSLLKYSISVLDTSLIVTDVTAQQTICSGTAPLIADKKEIHTNIIADTKSTINVQLYPNPATAILHITGLQGAATLTIINTTGVVIKRIAAHTANIEINIKGLPAGTYYLQVQGSSSAITKPFIKE